MYSNGSDSRKAKQKTFISIKIKVYYFKLSGAIKAPIAHGWFLRELKAKPGEMIGHVVSTT